MLNFKKKKTIGIINTNKEPYPLPNKIINGGLLITGILSDELAKRDNYNIVFFTAKDSLSHAKIESFNLNSYYNFSNKKILHEPYSPVDMKLILLREQDLFIKTIEYVNKHNIDLLHVNNYFFFIASLLPLLKKPIVLTLHNPIHEYHADYLNRLKNINLVVTSNKQAIDAKNYGIKVFDTVYNGIDAKIYQFNSNGGDNVLFCGRLIKEKGINEAISIAKNVKKTLDIVGNFENANQDNNMSTQISDIISKNTESLNLYTNSDLKVIIQKYQNSKLLIFPIQWEEPFGLVLTESMACGTPVVAFARGAVPEVIKDGITGFIVNPSNTDIRGDFIIKKTGIEGMCEAVEKIYNMNEQEYKQMRLNCRKHVDQHFTLEKMIDNYEAVYEKILFNKSK